MTKGHSAFQHYAGLKGLVSCVTVFVGSFICANGRKCFLPSEAYEEKVVSRTDLQFVNIGPKRRAAKKQQPSEPSGLFMKGSVAALRRQSACGLFVIVERPMRYVDSRAVSCAICKFPWFAIGTEDREAHVA